MYTLSEANMKLPAFEQEPEDAFIVRYAPVTLRCKAAPASQVYFRCNGDFVKAKIHTRLESVDGAGVHHIETSVAVTRDDVEEYLALNGFWCECVAWSVAGSTKSQRARVDIACKY
ncbi:PREDICTED: netrin receptor UNC5B-like [Priapulus caudatus]|uniref:Netrin receptor UNC5B-like n=1 Tax=Priapulus caudatus TaxID=37621 RepID=A0ABM1EEX1_PRICU|nr:PREDICTED: netrin receptor UNC5B-like [Priapulus caudatus]